MRALKGKKKGVQAEKTETEAKAQEPIATLGGPLTARITIDVVNNNIGLPNVMGTRTATYPELIETLRATANHLEKTYQQKQADAGVLQYQTQIIQAQVPSAPSKEEAKTAAA